MPLIPEGVLDDIQARVDIAELIGRYVPLKRVGRHFKTNCPFHKEKTPSFMVNTEKQIFHCFGCGVGGNVFSFLMQHDRLTFPEAVQQLADHAGVQIPERGTEARSESLDPLFALTEKACKYFERQLADPTAGRPGREYLKTRGVSEETAKVFRLGLAPAGWRGLLTAAGSTGVSAEQLESVGLIVKGSSNVYDRFRSRLIFPILDVRGRVVGFGGRSLDGQEPKYLNSPETPLYSKSRHVYGLAQAKDALVKAKTVIIVEGYFDCVGLAGAGITHVVAPLGTALTADQARLLRRYADRVILAFDPDAAGEQATLRGIDLVVETGLDVLVAQFPAGMDPDDYVRCYGRERTEQLLEQGINLFEFLVQSALRRFGTERTEAKVRAAQFVLPTIAKVPDAMLRREYVRQLAERMRLDEHAVVEELGKTQPRGTAAARPASATPVDRLTNQAPGPERLLTALVLDEPERWAQVGGAVSLADVTDPTLRRILGVVCELTSAGQPASAAQVVSRLSQDGQDAAVATLVELAGATPMKDQAFQDCIRRIQAKSRQRELANLREQIRTAQEAKHEVEWQRLLAVYQQRVMKHGEGG